MGRIDRLKKDWSNIVTFSCIIIAAIFLAVRQALADVPASVHVTHLEGHWNYLPLGLLVIAGVSWIVGRKSRKVSTVAQGIVLASGRAGMPEVPTLSSLQGNNILRNFDAREHFRTAYHSPLTLEAEKNIRIAAQQNSPSDREAFYVRFIGVGVASFLYEQAWAYILQSQLKMLAELNRRGQMPLSDIKKIYDVAVSSNRVNAKYLFESWLNFMVSHELVIKPADGIVAITDRGKDFLKYLTHWGRDFEVKTG